MFKEKNQELPKINISEQGGKIEIISTTIKSPLNCSPSEGCKPDGNDNSCYPTDYCNPDEKK